jgi:hypothetical protein
MASASIPDILPAAGAELEKHILAFIHMKAQHGIGFLKKESAYNGSAEAIQYFNGEQFPMRSKAVSRVVDNRLQKICLETTSALTDVRQIWNYDTLIEEFKNQGTILSKLARGWWRSNKIDRRLSSILLFSEVGGSGYGYLYWNPDLPGGGDFELIPMDPRDVIPIDPVYGDTIQDWRGVILRRRVSTEVLKAKYPSKADVLGRQTQWFPADASSGKGMIGGLVTSVWNVLTQPTSAAVGPSSPHTTDQLFVFIKDERIHSGAGPILMGDPRTNWSYWVYPVGSTHPQDGHIVSKEEARLYPRGRLIVCTPDAVLSDGPNPYWHGEIPLIKFTLDPMPWSLLGASMVQGLIPLQNSLNEALRGLDDAVGLWVRRGVIADKNAISKAMLDKLDTRVGGMKALVNPTAGEGFRVVDGPNLPAWYMQAIEFFRGEMDELSGTRGLQQMLAQFKQAPSSDAMEKFMDALSPVLRLRSRSIEVSLCELAEQLKVGFFQYYDAPRRMQILGKEGLTLEDFDYDPETLVPAGEGSRMERARNHHKNFTFTVVPNSFLNASHSAQKMMALQAFRSNALDPWTFWDTLDIPNGGKPPAETLPERIFEARRLGLMPGPPPEVIQAQTAMAMAQTQQALGQMSMGAVGQPGGEAPPTSGVGPQGGRPPSGQQAPQFVQKDQGERTVVSESGR